MVDLEYKIGGLDLEYPTALSKFIVHREDERTLSVYALAKEMGEYPIKHDDVTEYFNLQRKNVLGAGNYRYGISSQDLILDDWSLAFGSIPEQVAQRVGENLADHFRRSGITIREIRVNMTPIFKNEANREIWKSLGFDIPN